MQFGGWDEDLKDGTCNNLANSPCTKQPNRIMIITISYLMSTAPTLQRNRYPDIRTRKPEWDDIFTWNPYSRMPNCLLPLLPRSAPKLVLLLIHIFPESPSQSIQRPWTAKRDHKEPQSGVDSLDFVASQVNLLLFPASLTNAHTSHLMRQRIHSAFQLMHEDVDLQK